MKRNWHHPKKLWLLLIVGCVLAEAIYLILSPRVSLFRRENHLRGEKSPYLKQHVLNPVDWYPWNDAAFSKAVQENKPIFLSIGYSTCHWCQVMAKESFENRAVAELLNHYFVSIKVDREEHPDVDHLYMAFLQETSGQGGWPMTIVAGPDGRPFFGASYIPTASLVEALEKIRRAWQDDPKRAQAFAQVVYENLLNQSLLPAQSFARNDEIFRRVFSKLETDYDPKNGGFGSAPKFPEAQKLALLLRIARRSSDARPRQMLEQTLFRMASGEMYDPVGGGFHRYAMQPDWRRPHFEKMLDDNAVLARLYLEAFQWTNDPSYKEIALQTLAFLQREMLATNGGFFSALDSADDGKYYAWTRAQIDAALGPRSRDFLNVFNLDDGRLSIHPKTDPQARFSAAMRENLGMLLSARSKRTPPFRDDKLLTSSNALAISAFAKAYQVTQEAKYLTIAEQTAQAIQHRLQKNDAQIFRRWSSGEAKYDATLDDYALLIDGLLNLYEADFNAKWLVWAIDLQKRQNEIFWDESQGGFFYVPENTKHLMVRRKEFYDDQRPNAMGLSITNLLRLHALTAETEFLKKADATITSLGWLLERVPEHMPSVVSALDYRTDRSPEIALIPGNNSPDDIRRFFQRRYLPNKVFAMRQDEGRSIALLEGKTPVNGKSTVYICEAGRCGLPLVDLAEIEREALKVKPYALLSVERR